RAGLGLRTPRALLLEGDPAVRTVTRALGDVLPTHLVRAAHLSALVQRVRPVGRHPDAGGVTERRDLKDLPAVATDDPHPDPGHLARAASRTGGTVEGEGPPVAPITGLLVQDIIARHDERLLAAWTGVRPLPPVVG